MKPTRQTAPVSACLAALPMPLTSCPLTVPATAALSRSWCTRSKPRFTFWRTKPLPEPISSRCGQKRWRFTEAAGSSWLSAPPCSGTLPPDRQGDLGIGRQRQFGIGHRRIVVAARCEKHCGTRQQRCRTSHEPKFFHRDKIYEIRCTIAVWANIRNIYRKTISPKGGRDTSEGRANGSFAGF